MQDQERAPLFCDRCSVELQPGRGSYYVVSIEAIADPSPPVFTEDDLATDPSAEIEHLIEKMRAMSPQELQDQVYRRVILYLCVPCYGAWIEDPTADRE